MRRRQAGSEESMDHAVVLAGGSGTRFWPESRARRAKQFLDLTGKGPMIVETLRRLSPLVPPGNLWVVAGEKDREHLVPSALGIPPENLLLEPLGKNTGPAMAFAVETIWRRDPAAVIVASPADHVIGDVKRFRAIVRRGLRLARKTGSFVTLGIPPTRPATGYGYIERGKPYEPGTDGAFRVRRFTEKPDAATARRFLRTGRFDWNSGIFVLRADVFRDRVERFLPEVHAAVGAAFRFAGKASFAAELKKAYRKMPSISVDYGILEKEREILLLPAAVGWSDIGTWRSLHEFLGGGKGNVFFGDVIAEDCRNILVRSDRGVVAVLGMEDVVVVRSGDAVLVCPRSRSEEVKGIVDRVRAEFPDLA
jgi:mannose-1-phosphate guanylyltransferase